jgi:hypothetical protein
MFFYFPIFFYCGASFTNSPVAGTSRLTFGNKEARPKAVWTGLTEGRHPNMFTAAP